MEIKQIKKQAKELIKRLKESYKKGDNKEVNKITLNIILFVTDLTHL